jgi:LCCL domain
MSNDKKDSSVVGQIAVGILVALIAGGTSPWWVDKLFPKPNSSLNSTTPTTSPTALQTTPSPSASSSVETPVPKPPSTTPTPVVSELAVPQLQWSDTALSLRGRLDQDFTYMCRSGGRVETVYGTDVYTDDSSICSAAVHAGLITARDGGKVIIRIRPGGDSYVPTDRNGVRSKRYGGWGGGFIFLK